MAANSVPTAANPMVPASSTIASQNGLREERRLEQQRDERNEHDLAGQEERHDTQQLADVDRRPGGWRQQQGAQRFRLPLALEGPPERERAGKRDRNPQDPRGAVLRRAPLAHERKGKDEHARHGEEQRRVGDLEAADLDGQVLAQHEPDDAGEHQARLMTSR